MRRPHIALALCAALATGCGGAPSDVRGAEDEADEGPPPTFAIALRLEDAGADENDTPHTRVRLVRIEPAGDRVVADLGTENAACYHRDEAGALIAATCWWAGTGASYVVRREADAVVAYRTEVDEESGQAEPREVGRVDVPEDAQLQIVGAAPSMPAP